MYETFALYRLQFRYTTLQVSSLWEHNRFEGSAPGIQIGYYTKG